MSSKKRSVKSGTNSSSALQRSKPLQLVFVDDDYAVQLTMTVEVIRLDENSLVVKELHDNFPTIRTKRSVRYARRRGLYGPVTRESVVTSQLRMLEPSGSSGPAIIRLIQDQFLQEQGIKDSLESRASAVIASAGTLVTLLFALVALVTKPGQYSLPATSRFLIGVALVAFLAAAVLAILVIRPRVYGAVDEQSLHDLAKKSAYSTPASVGEPHIADAIIDLITKARAANARKAHFLTASVVAEVIAVVVLGSAIGVMLAAGW
jgi:hypothetical protein